MLGFIEGTKYFKTQQGIQVVLKQATFLVPAQKKVGVLAGMGQGKSTIINLLAGLDTLNEGMLIKQSSTWLLGYAGLFHPFLKASENLNLLAELHFLEPLELRMYCQDFAELSWDDMNLKLADFSANMRAKLAYALSLAIPCDVLLADDKLTVGNDAFRIKCEAALELKLKHTGLIFFSRNPKLTQGLEEHAQLKDGNISWYASHEEACLHFKADYSDRMNETLW